MTYHIVNEEKKIVAKFSATNLEDVWKKFNKRAKELLLGATDFYAGDLSFGRLAWTGTTKQGKPEKLFLAKVQEDGTYSFVN